MACKYVKEYIFYFGINFYFWHHFYFGFISIFGLLIWNVEQEAWWLKRASHRSRCRIIAECAEAFGIEVPTMRDIHSHDSETVRMAIPTMDTVEYDLTLSKDGKYVQIFDACTNINSIKNGFLASMHPSEGFWIFKGVHDRSKGSNSYGVAWHTNSSLPAGIPSCVIKVPMSTTSKIQVCDNFKCIFPFIFSFFDFCLVQEKANEKARKLHYATALTKDSSAIVRVNMVETNAEPQPEKEQLYQFFDEAYLQQVSKLGWHRDMGVVELIPIVVGISVI